MTVFDYASLRVIWWGLLGALLIGFAVMDGFDLGAGMLLPFVARSDGERRAVINTVGPVWEGNQVWLILGGGATFAAWPPLYAVAFSGFYLAMFLVLLALILRAVAFTFRSKLQAPAWRRSWDWILCVSGVVAALVFGVAVGNTLEGVPFRFDESLRMTYEGGFFALFSPFAILCGIVSVAMMAMHGGAYLAVKTEGETARRARQWGFSAAIIALLLFALAGLFIARGVEGYRLVGSLSHDAPSNPLGKSVIRELGAWLANYRTYPWMMAAPALGGAGAFLAALLLALGAARTAFVSSALSIAGIVATFGVSMFPFLLPSSLDPAMSLTVWDASSSRTTLAIMLVATLVFLPVVIAYTGFIFRVMRGKVSPGRVEADPMSY
jgi:cytochrome bd ubiquinol oxidase subunit II